MANVKLSGKYWEEFTTPKHEKVYTLLGAPRLPWKDGAGHGKTYPWFGALEFVIGPNGKEQQYGAHGAVDGHDAMKKITKYLFEGLGKVYDHVGGNSTLYSGGTWNFDKYISTESGKVNCHDQSTALNTCARLLGIES